MPFLRLVDDGSYTTEVLSGREGQSNWVLRARSPHRAYGVSMQKGKARLPRWGRGAT